MIAYLVKIAPPFPDHFPNFIYMLCCKNILYSVDNIFFNSNGDSHIHDQTPHDNYHNWKSYNIAFYHLLSRMLSENILESLATIFWLPNPNAAYLVVQK